MRSTLFMLVVLGCRQQNTVQDRPANAADRVRSERPASAADEVYSESQVERPVVPAPGNTGPRYPDQLRLAKVEGELLVQFVVDTSGRADMSTFKVLKSSHGMFSEAARTWLETARFRPAELGGRKVKQQVQQPFNFFLPH